MLREGSVWRYILTGAVVALFAVGTAVGASGREDVTWALAFGGFAVSGIAVGLMKRRPRKPRRDATRKGHVQIDGIEVPALEIPMSRAKTQLAVLGSLGFVESGIAIGYTGRVVIAVLTVVTFGAFALIGVRNLFTPPVVALSERGVHWRSGSGHRWVPWDEVEAVYLTEISSAPSLGVSGTNGPRFEGRSWGRLFARFGKLGDDINVPVDIVGVDPELLEGMIEELVEHPESRKGIADRGALATGPPGTARFSEL